MKLKETVVVEGRDDMSAVLAAVEADIIITHGYGITQKTLENIDAAYKRNGIVIFTDPDHAGRRIREWLEALFPDAKHAYLTERQA
ncbi:MAG: toprim domain-containing protein, partial [Firmicutes bacterium]|nr:toprim domain-containing protein [Bacillota bacterium]